MRLSHEKVLEWLVPAMLAILGWIGLSMSGNISQISEKMAEMNANLRLALFRIDKTDQNVDALSRRVDENKAGADEKSGRTNQRLDETNRRVETLERTMLGVKAK